MPFLGNRTINKEISFLSAVMNYGTQIGVLKVSPCVGIKYLRELPRKRYITDQELKAFCEFVGKSNPLMVAYLRFRYITGRRDCEVLSLEYDDVVPEGIMFYIAKKSGLGVRFPVVQIWNDSFREVYNELVGAAASVHGSKPSNQDDSSSQRRRHVICKKNGERYTTEGWSAIFRRLMDSAIREGILEQRFTLHDIRSKTASDIRNVAVASRVLAHYNIATTDKNYNLLDEKIPALDRIL